MNIDAHVKKLTAKHSQIDETISAEEHRPAPDTLRLKHLKKEKLRIKETIGQFMRH